MDNLGRDGSVVDDLGGDGRVVDNLGSQRSSVDDRSGTNILGGRKGSVVDGGNGSVRHEVDGGLAHNRTGDLKIKKKLQGGTSLPLVFQRYHQSLFAVHLPSLYYLL